MPVMNKMRENTHIILFVLLVLFLLSMTIGGLVGGADITHLFGRRPDTILSINGENISYEQYNNFYQQQIETYRQQNQKEPQGYELQQFESQIWEALIRDILMKQLAEKMDIKVSKSEIAYYIFDNPPDFLRSNPNFQDDNGNFDIKKYQAALNDDRNATFWNYIQNYLMGTLPYNKIYQQVASSVFITDEEVKQEYIKQNLKAKVKYILFDANKFPVNDSEITQKEIENYYNENKEKYKEEEKRKIQYVLFQVIPSASDTSEVISFAETLLDSINQGVDFARLAETNSEDAGSAEKGGDLDYFERGMMVKSFEDAAFSANSGTVVGPIISQHGVHIIKVEDKKVEDGKEKVRARHILLKFKPTNNTFEAIRDNANYFVEIATEEGFDITAANEKMKVDTTDYFASSGFIPKLGMQSRIVDAIFHSKVGKMSRVHYIEDRGYIVYQLIDIQKERYKSVQEVESIIKNAVRQEKQKALARKAAEQFRAKFQSPDDFERLAEQDSLTIVETENFAIGGFVRSVGRDPKFNGEAFALPFGEVSSVVDGLRGAYIIKSIEKDSYVDAGFNLQKETLLRELLDRKQRTVYNDWYTNLKESAKIKDFRYMFF